MRMSMDVRHGPVRGADMPMLANNQMPFNHRSYMIDAFNSSLELIADWSNGF